MSIPPASIDSRSKGNEAFRLADYSTAVHQYTEAYKIVDDTYDESGPVREEKVKEHLAAVLSNRAAARINLFDLDLALLDSSAALEIKPEFSRARARQGEAHSRLHDYKAAQIAYSAAVEIAEDAPARIRYQAAAASSSQHLDDQNKEDVHPLLVAAENSLEFAKRYDKFVTEGGEVEDLISANSAVYAWTVMDKAWDILDEKLKVLDSGEVESESPSPVLDIADSLVTDARGFHLPPGKDHELPLSEKLRLQLSWDSQVYGLGPYLKKDVIPRDVIDAFNQQVGKDGWQRVKLALSHLIRGSFVAAFINESQGRTLEACSQFRFVIGLLQEGRKRWADVSEDDRGTTFRFTFERKVKMHLIESLVEGHYKSTTPELRKAFSLHEVKALAEEIMDDCRENKAPSDPVSTFAFQVQPIVSAGKAFAYTLRDQAQREENRLNFQAGYFLHPKMMKAAARLYATAGELLPQDDPEKAVNLFNALAFDLRGGGMTIRELFRRAGAAEQALVPPERIFGPASRQFDSRALVRSACETARSTVAVSVPFRPDSYLEATLKPVATVFASEIPRGKTWQDCVDPKIFEFLEGQIHLVEYATLQK